MSNVDYSQDKFVGIMVSGWIRDLERSDSRLHKESVIEKALMASKLGSAEAQAFLFNCYQAYNPFYIFGIKQVAETQNLVGMPNPWPRFWAILEALRTRSFTGNNARLQIQRLSEQFDSDEWNTVCRRVLIKDLRCGISEKTLNKVLSKTEWAIPVFGCQLAQDSNDHPKKLTGLKRLEAKLDGVRVLAVVNGSSCVLYSRNGKVFENFPHIQQAIQDNLHVFQRGLTTPGYFVLDGEIVGESFQNLMRQTHRKNNAKTHDMVYYIFDIIPLADFLRGHYNTQLHKRLDRLEYARPGCDKTECLRVMQGFELDLSTAEGHDIMRRWAEDAVAHGYEGIMIKSLDAPYECKRNDFWMKWKPTITVDLNIIGFEQGTGRNLGRLGAIVCEGVDNGRTIRVNVGSGLSDSNRDQYWTARQDLIGRVVEIQADAVTQNQDGSYSLRFPRFVRFRGFEAGEKF